MPYISPGLLPAALRILLATLRIKFLDIEFYTCFAALFFVSSQAKLYEKGPNFCKYWNFRHKNLQEIRNKEFWSVRNYYILAA